MTENEKLLLEVCQTLLLRSKDFIATDMQSAQIREELDWCQSTVDDFLLIEAMAVISNGTRT